VRGTTEQMRGALEVRLRDARDALHALGPVPGDERAHLAESLGAIANVGVVDEPVAHDHVEKPVGHDSIRSGRGRRCSVPARAVAVLRGSTTTMAAPARESLEVLHHRGHRLRDVAPGKEQHGVGLADVFQRKRQAPVGPERPREDMQNLPL
jgi:hypothetical protein